MVSDLLIIILSAIILIVIFASSILGQKKAGNIKVKCLNCSHIFNPFFLRFFLTFSVSSISRILFSAKVKERYYLKCPKCKKFSSCLLIEGNKKI